MSHWDKYKIRERLNGAPVKDFSRRHKYYSSKEFFAKKCHKYL